MKIKGLTPEELLILVNTLWESVQGATSSRRSPETHEERNALMHKLSDARTELIIQRNKDDFDMRQQLAREDR